MESEKESQSDEEPFSDQGEEEEGEESSEQSSNEDDLRQALAGVPLGELQSMRETVGCKKFDSALRGHANESGRKLSRANKNRPSEQSSKKRVSRSRDVVPVKRRVKRDPRFDDLSGNYNEDLFKKSYTFLDGYRQAEKKEIKKELRKSKDATRRADLKALLSEMQQREARVAKLEAEQSAKRELRKQQVELMKQGKKPYYLKNSEKKKLELAQKFQDLKKKGKLEKFVEKKRKRNASRDHRRMPYRRKETDA